MAGGADGVEEGCPVEDEDGDGAVCDDKEEGSEEGEVGGVGHCGEGGGGGYIYGEGCCWWGRVLSMEKDVVSGEGYCWWRRMLLMSDVVDARRC